MQLNVSFFCYKNNSNTNTNNGWDNDKKDNDTNHQLNERKTVFVLSDRIHNQGENRLYWNSVNHLFYFFLETHRETFHVWYQMKYSIAPNVFFKGIH